MIIAILGGAAVFFVFLAIYSLFSVRRKREEANEKLIAWIKGKRHSLSWSDSIVDRLDKMKWAQKLVSPLERAGLNLRPAEFVPIVIMAGVILGFVLAKGFGIYYMISIGLSVVITPLGAWLFLRSRDKVYITKIEAQLSEACRMLASSARAGLSVPQGLQIVIQELTGPIRNELATVVQQLNIGRDIDSALNELSERVPSRDIQVFVNALIIQRKSGGDLALVLGEMANTMEERKIIKKTIDAYTSQTRYAAYMLPIASLFVVFIMSNVVEGFDALFTHIFGIISLVIFVILQLIGILLVKKFSTIRV